MRRALSAWAMVLGGCVGGVSELDPASRVPDATAPASVDAGVLVDAGEVPDAGVVPDASGVVDAGAAPECPSEWVTIASATGGYGIESRSLAALPGVFAVTWSSYDENWGETASLGFFDAAGSPIAAPRAIALGSRVIAVGDRFLRGGPDGIEWLRADGSSEATIDVGPFVPSAVVGGVVYGRVPLEGTASPAMLVDDGAQVELLGLDVPLEAELVFGPDRFVVVERGMTGALVRLYDLASGAAMLMAEHVMMPEELAEERWVATDLSAGIWNDDLDRFDLLFAMNVANGRFFGVRLFGVEGVVVTQRAQLPGQPVRVTHGSLEGHLAASRGRFLVAYNDSYSGLGVELVLLHDGIEARFPLGGPIRSRPRLVALERGFAVLSARRTAGAGSWENELRLRCATD